MKLELYGNLRKQFESGYMLCCVQCSFCVISPYCHAYIWMASKTCAHFMAGIYSVPVFSQNPD